MKEFFDQLRDEAEQHELPQPAELRARGDRRVARRGAAGAFSLAVVMAGGFIAARPLFHAPPTVIAEGTVSAFPSTIPPETIVVPDVRGMSRSEATSVLQEQGFKVQVRAASPPPSGAAESGRVRQQTPVSAKMIPSETTVTIWVDGPQEPATPVCADKYPKALLTALFVKTDVEICYAGNDSPAAERLPVPCPQTAYASESLIEDRRGFTGIFPEQTPGGDPTSTTLDQTITKYRGTGAKDYLTELTSDVERCQPVTRGKTRLTYSMQTQPPQEKLGEQSLLINVEFRLTDKSEMGTPEIGSFLVSVVRVGLNVVVIYDKGWQGRPSKPETVLDTARELLRRLTASPNPAR